MDIRLEPFAPEHFAQMELRPEDEADIAGLDPASLTASWEGGVTVFYRERPAWFYGAVTDGSEALIWAVTSPLVDRLPLLFAKRTKGLIKGLWESGAQRIAAHCHRGNRRSLRFLLRLGFELEGLMRKCGPNAQDRWLLAMVRRDA